MTRLLVAIAGWLILAAAPVARAEQTAPQAADLLATLQPAVVNIATVVRERTPALVDNIASQPSVSDHVAQGSGFFVAASGIIVTNRHAIAGASEITVTLHDNTRLHACVLAKAEQSDIALLKVNADRPMPVLKFAPTDAVRPGDRVYVVGNPLGLGSTVTSGIVSALNRVTPQSEFGAFFQIDASLNHGSSGGPVFNSDGDVVGVATALISPEGASGSVGLGLAIPASDVRLIVARLLGSGQVRLGWIGVHVEPVTADIATAAKLSGAGGSIVTAVEADSPAAHAGLVPGDVILQADDLDLIKPTELNHVVAAGTIGSTLKLAVWQDGVQRAVTVVVAEVPGDKPAAEPSRPTDCRPARGPRRDLGLRLGEVTGEARNTLGLGPHDAGVLVTEVLADTAAADRGLTAGSLIVNVQRQPVRSPAEVQAGIDAARQQNRAAVLMLVRYPLGLRWIALPLGGTPVD